ncbi:unnamed protein product [Brassica oleracea]
MTWGCWKRNWTQGCGYAVMGPRTIKHETVVSEAAAPASAPHVANSMGSASCNSYLKPLCFIGSYITFMLLL